MSNEQETKLSPAMVDPANSPMVKQSQTELAELVRFFEMSFDMLAIAGTDGYFKRVNPAFERTLGWTAAELLAQPFLNFVHPHDVPATLTEVEKLAQGATTIHFENRYRCPDGSYKWLAWNAQPAADGTIYAVAREVTAFKEVGRSLEQARFVIENSPVVVFRWRAAENWPVDYVSDNVRQFGYTPEELLSGETLYASIVHPDDMERVAQEVQFYSTEGIDNFQQEYRIITKDGRVRWTDDRTVIERDENGQITYYQGIVLDVTERKRVEQELHIRTQAIEASLDSISIADARLPDTPLVYVNPAFEKMTGYSVDEVLGRNCRFLQGEDRDQPAVPEMHAAIAEGRTCVVTLRNYRKDGTLFWNELQLFPLRDAKGAVTHFIGVQNDITDRRQAELHLRQVTEFQKTIFDNAAYAIISATPEGIITSFNSAAERMLGYQAEELVAKETPAIFHDLSEVVERAQIFSEELGVKIEPGFEVFVAKARHNLPNEHEWTYIHKSNRRFPVSLSVTALRDAEGEITGFVGIARDITERKQAEDTLAKRAAELTTVAQISASISTITEPQQMLQTVVDLTKENFDLYHAHIYLLNERQDMLMLAAGAGEIGRQMVTQGWRIELDREHSLVAQAARDRTGIIANNVRETPDFLPNSLLPNTRSELAVPIIAGDELLGVLDVQADSLNRFTEEDVRIETTLASQIAVALQNARSFARSEAALKELNALTRRLTRQGWESYLETQPEQGYVYDLQQVHPLSPAGNGIDDPVYPKGKLEPDSHEIEHALTVQGERIGLVSVVDPQELGDEADEIIGAVVERLSAHIENMRLTEQAQIALAEAEDQAHRLALLNEMATALNQTTTEEEIFQIVATKTDQILESERTSIALLTQTGDQLEVLALDGTKGAIPTGMKLPLEGTAVGAAIRENRIILTGDTRQSHYFDCRKMSEQGLLTTMNVPLITTEQIIGSISVATRSLNAYGPGEEGLMQQVALLLASHLENRRLFEQTRAALEEARIFRQFVEAAGQGIGFTTLDGKIQYMNPAFAEILDEPDPGQTVGKSILTYYSEEMQQFINNETLPTVMRDGRWTGETTLLSVAGRETHVIDSYFLLKDAQDNPIYLADITTDITDRKQAEQQLRRLSQAIEQSPNMVIIIDLKGNIEYINPRFTEITGFTPEEIVGQNPRILGSETPEEVYRQLWQTITLGNEWRGELINKKKNGEVYWVSVTISPVTDTGGNIISFLAVQEDITERKAAEAERERLLAEVQAAYQEYVRREWGQYLGEEHDGHWHIEHHQPQINLKSIPNGHNLPTIVKPIAVRGEAVGTLRLQDIDPEREWTPEEIALVETVSEQLGVTIENLRLFKDTQKQATREQLTRQITDKMRAAPDIDTIIQTGLSELARALGVSRSYVKLSPVSEPDNDDEPNT